jgi:hypothetical protein
MLTAKQYQELATKGGVNKKGRITIDPKTLDAMNKPVALPAPKVSSKKTTTPKKEKRGKFGNIKVTDPDGGKKFDSKLEAKHGKEYAQMFKDGKIAALARQIPFNIGAGVKYIPDFLIVHLDGSLEAVDSKGIETSEFKIKAKFFREKYPTIKLTIRSK